MPMDEKSQILKEELIYLLSNLEGVTPAMSARLNKICNLLNQRLIPATDIGKLKVWNDILIPLFVEEYPSLMRPTNRQRVLAFIEKTELYNEFFPDPHHIGPTKT